MKKLYTLLFTVFAACWALSAQSTLLEYTVTLDTPKNEEITLDGGSIKFNLNTIETKADIVGAKLDGDSKTVVITLDEAFRAGDVITANAFATSNPSGSDYGVKIGGNQVFLGAKVKNTIAPLAYTVVENDGICGTNTVTIMRAASASTYLAGVTVTGDRTPAVDFSGWWINFVGPFNKWSSDEGVQADENGIATKVLNNVGADGLKVKIWKGEDDWRSTGSQLIADRWIDVPGDNNSNMTLPVEYREGQVTVKYDVVNNRIMLESKAIDYSSWYLNVPGEHNEWVNNGVQFSADGLATVDIENFAGEFKLKVYNGSDMWLANGETLVPGQEYTLTYNGDNMKLPEWAQNATAHFTFNAKTSALTVTTEAVAPAPLSATWNFSNWADVNATETFAVDGLTVYAAEGAAVVIEANSKKVDGVQYTKRLKTGGAGAWGEDGEPISRVLAFNVPGAVEMKFAMTSSSSSAERTMNVYAGSKENLIATIENIGDPAIYTAQYKGSEPTTIFVESAEDGINFYSIAYETIEVEPVIDYTKWYVNIPGEHNEWGDNGVACDAEGFATIVIDDYFGEFKVKVWNGSEDIWYSEPGEIALGEPYILSVSNGEGNNMILPEKAQHVKATFYYNVVDNILRVEAIITGGDIEGETVTVYFDNTDTNWEEPVAVYYDAEGATAYAAMERVAAPPMYRALAEGETITWDFNVYSAKVYAESAFVMFIDAQDPDAMSDSFDIEANHVYNATEDLGEYGDIVTSVANIAAENQTPVYYNLQGQRVDNPENGIYIRRLGNNVAKVLVK